MSAVQYSISMYKLLSNYSHINSMRVIEQYTCSTIISYCEYKGKCVPLTSAMVSLRVPCKLTRARENPGSVILEE